MPIARKLAASLAAMLAMLPRVAQAQSPAAPPERALLNQYCVTCHNDRLKTGGLMRFGRMIGVIMVTVAIWWIMPVQSQEQNRSRSVNAARSRQTGSPQKRYPVFTLTDLVNTMKMVDRNVGGANTALARSDFATAKAQITRAREQLATTITFWRDHKKDDAIKTLRETLTKMDDLDAALSVEKVDATAASVLARQVGAACESCHAVYRDQDPATKAYRLKPGTVEPAR